MGLLRFIRRSLFWVLLGVLAWDLYSYGPEKSVAVNAGTTLAARIREASKSITPLVAAAVAELHRYFESREDVASANMFPFMFRPPAKPAQLDEDAMWAIQLASRRTKISTDYLLTTAYMEANFDARARSTTSSAAGMYQFIDSTWLQLMAQHGHDYGWAGFASAIACTPSGRCKYKGPDGLTKVMDLRYDSMTATFLSAELARSNKSDLTKALGRNVKDSELYLAHFLGVSGAITLIKARDRGETRSAAALFPQAAAANRSLFYRGARHPYTCAEFYDAMEARWERGRRAVANLSIQSAPGDQQAEEVPAT